MKGMQAADAWLRNISVVIVANTYQPDVIYRDLVNCKIMPSKSEIVQSTQVPGGCDARYSNGMYIAVNQQRVAISNDYDEPFEQCLNDEVHTLAAEFVKTYNDVSYRAIGLNCIISLQHSNPLRWMTRKFLKAKSLPSDVSMVPRFGIKTDDGGLALAFASAETTDHGRRKRFVTVDCNHHHGGPFNTDADILRTVKGWQDTRDTILSRLGEVLGLE